MNIRRAGDLIGYLKNVSPGAKIYFKGYDLADCVVEADGDRKVEITPKRVFRK